MATNGLLKHKVDKVKLRLKKGQGKTITNPVTYLWVLNPFVQALIWASAIILGASASLFATEIISFYLPWSPEAGSDANWYTTSFIMAIIIVSFLFSLSSWVARAQDSYIIDSLLTAPPSSYWTFYGQEFIEATNLMEMNSVGLWAAVDDLAGMEGDEPHENITYKYKYYEDYLKLAYKDVRRMLDSCIRLVKEWDTSNIVNSNVVYRANVMKVYRLNGSSALGKSDDELLKKLNILAERFTVQPSKEHYTGFVAIIDNEYTTTTDSREPLVDNIQPIAFPFSDNNNKPPVPFKVNILGAPEAASTGVHSYVHNVSEIIDYYTNSDNVNATVLANLKNYYSNNTIANSILSLPIVDSGTGMVTYIVNIYRNQDGLLLDGQKVNDFAQLILPFTGHLGTLMNVIEDVKVAVKDTEAANIIDEIKAAKLAEAVVEAALVEAAEEAVVDEEATK